LFQYRLVERGNALNTRLCLGLDPRLAAYDSVEAMRSHTLAVLEAVAPFIACVKPQAAFYEAAGLPGLQLMDEVMALARRLDVPVLLDAKRGDIGSTAEAYAQAWLEGRHAGNAITINPYLGFATLQPFVASARRHGGAVFVLVRTSNPDSGDLQGLMADGSSVAEHVAREVARLGEEEAEALASVGAVVGATHPAELARFRALMPKATLLLPGLGAQGATAATLAPAFLADGAGAVVSASRGIQYAQGCDLDAAVAAAQGFRDELNLAAGQHG